MARQLLNDVVLEPLFEFILNTSPLGYIQRHKVDAGGLASNHRSYTIDNFNEVRVSISRVMMSHHTLSSRREEPVDKLLSTACVARISCNANLTWQSRNARLRIDNS